MKNLLNVINLFILVGFILMIVTGMPLKHDLSGLSAHLGWILGTLLVWLFSTILSMLYMFRMEKFCVEIVEKFDGDSNSNEKSQEKPK